MSLARTNRILIADRRHQENIGKKVSESTIKKLLYVKKKLKQLEEEQRELEDLDFMLERELFDQVAGEKGSSDLFPSPEPHGDRILKHSVELGEYTVDIGYGLHDGGSERWLQSIKHNGQEEYVY